MRMRVDRLREAVNLLGPAVPKKPSIAALKSVLLKDGYAVANDLETAIVLELPEAEGVCLFPFHSLPELLKRVPGNEVMTLEQTNTRLELSWPGGKATYTTFDPQDYPPFPNVEVQAEKSVDGDTLVPALISLTPYCATEQARPVLCGVAMTLGNTVKLAGADGFRLGVQQLPITFTADGIDTIIIPTGAIGLLEHLWKHTPRPAPVADSFIGIVIARRELELAVGKGMLRTRFGMVTMVTRLIEGSFPNYQQLIPTDNPITVKFYAPELERVLRGISTLARDAKGLVRLSWTETTMSLGTESEDEADVEMALPVTASAPGRIGFNIGYLLAYLKGKQGLVTLGVKTPQSPALLQHSASPLTVVMPMFVQWQGDPEPEKPPETTEVTEAETEATEEGPDEGETTEQVTDD